MEESKPMMKLEFQLLFAVFVVAISTALIIYSLSQKKVVKFLNKEDRKVLKAPLKDIIIVSPDTRTFRFKLPNNTCLGLPCGNHIKIFASNPNYGKETWNSLPDNEKDEKQIERKYTPTSSDSNIGYFDLLVKVYKPNERFCNGGKLSQYLESMKIGDELEFSGPWGMIEYIGRGYFKKSKKEIFCKDIGMIAGGTGITPMLQIIEAILSDEEDQTSISLLFANQTEDDILLRNRLLELGELFSDRFRVHFTLDRPPENWKFSKGFVKKEMIEENMPPPTETSVILMCGPPLMIKSLKNNLTELKYPHQLEF